MFCPSCSSYLHELQLIKSNAKYMPGTREPVEYDARCPVCNKEIGRMSWGQLTVNPELEIAEETVAPAAEPDEEAVSEASEAAEAQQDDAPPSEPSPDDAPPPEQENAAKLCPHCGLPLPEGY